jgi:hypothetical protein
MPHKRAALESTSLPFIQFLRYSLITLHVVASSDKRKQQTNKLIKENIEIVAMARATVPKAEQATITVPMTLAAIWILELRAPYFL